MSVIVIKYGGSLLEERGHRSAFLKDVTALSGQNKVILVHGGGKEISRQMEKSGLKPNFVNGRRYTDEATLVVVQRALAGLNAEIVSELASLGTLTSGGSGQDNHLIEATAVVGLGRVGIPTKVDDQVLKQMLSGKGMPVLYSVAEDDQRQPLNVNADDFALALATACRADHLVFLTDTGGVLDPQGKLISEITSEDVVSLAEQDVITGGMLVKAKACADALRRGVGRVAIVKGVQYLLEPGKTQSEGTVFVNEH